MRPDGAPEDGAGPPAGWLVAVAATLGMSVSYVDRQTLAAIGSSVRDGLGVDHTHFGWLVSAFSMAYLVFAPLAGTMVDRLGARRGFALAMVAWTLVATSHALATSFAALFALRVLLGMTEAPSFPAAAQAIRRALPGARRTAAFGLLFTGSSIGQMIAAPLAVHLEARHGFRFAFLGTAVAGTVWLPFWLWATRGGRLAPSRPRTPLSMAPPSTVRADLGAALRSPAVLRSLVAILGSAPALMFVLNWTPQLLVESFHVPKDATGAYLVFPPLFFDVGAVGIGFFASGRTPRGRAGTHSDLLVAAGVLGSAILLVPLVASPATAVALLSVAAVGGGGIYVLVTADMLSRVPLGRTSVSGGLTAAAQSLAHILAAPLVGRAIDRTHGYGLALTGLGAVVLPAVLVFVLWPSFGRAPARA